MKRTGRGQRIARGGSEIGPHFRAAVIVVVAMNPMHGDASIEQQRELQFIERAITLNVAKQHGGFGWRCQGGEARVDVMPVLMNVPMKTMDMLFRAAIDEGIMAGWSPFANRFRHRCPMR